MKDPHFAPTFNLISSFPFSHSCSNKSVLNLWEHSYKEDQIQEFFRNKQPPLHIISKLSMPFLCYTKHWSIKGHNNQVFFSNTQELVHTSFFHKSYFLFRSVDFSSWIHNTNLLDWSFRFPRRFYWSFSCLIFLSNIRLYELVLWRRDHLFCLFNSNTEFLWQDYLNKNRQIPSYTVLENNQVECPEFLHSRELRVGIARRCRICFLLPELTQHRSFLVLYLLYFDFFKFLL